MNIDVLEFIILALAAYRLSRVIIEDVVLEKFRDLIWNRYGSSTGIGYFITCYWCVGFWFSSLLVLLFIIVPIPTIAVSLVLALSAVTGIIAARVDR